MNRNIDDGGKLRTDMRQPEYAVEVENLNVRYVTSDSTVMAVNGIDLKLKRKRRNRCR